MATTDCALAVCSAPGHGGHEARRLGPEGIDLTPRGKGTNTRHVNNIAMEGRDVADSPPRDRGLHAGRALVVLPEPPPRRGRLPPHDLPGGDLLHRLNPAQGFAVQRVYTEDGTLDETMAVRDGDVTLVPRGHHPCGAPYGYELYYLNVMAGPRRKWRFQNDPDHDWIAQRDA